MTEHVQVPGVVVLLLQVPWETGSGGVINALLWH